MSVHRIPQPGEPLSRRELEVLELAAQGLANARIAARLFLTEDTVKNHMSRLMRKLGVSGRTEAVAAGYRRELLRDGAVPVLPAGWEALVAVAEGVVAGRPLASVRREALEALTAAGRRGPGGRPLAPDARVAS